MPCSSQEQHGPETVTSVDMAIRLATPSKAMLNYLSNPELIWLRTQPDNNRLAITTLAWQAHSSQHH
jgi:hypothetical protein